MKEIARRYRVSLRTAQRYMAGELVDVEVGGWVATFASVPGVPPWRTTSWREIS